MTDVVDETIDMIHAELCRLMLCQNVKIEHGNERRLGPEICGPSIAYTIGGDAKFNHKCHHSVSWIEQGGKTVSAESRDEDGYSYSNETRLRVLIQAPHKENARLLFENLLNVSRIVCGDQVSWGNSTAPTEEKQNALLAVFAIEADCDMTVPIPKNINKLVGFPDPLVDYVPREVLSASATVE